MAEVGWIWRWCSPWDMGATVDRGRRLWSTGYLIPSAVSVVMRGSANGRDDRTQRSGQESARDGGIGVGWEG